MGPGSPPREKASFRPCVCFGFPQEGFQRGSRGSGHTSVPHSSGGLRESSLVLIRGLNCLFCITQKGKRKYLPLSQIHKPPVDVFCLCFPPEGCFRTSANTKLWGSVCYSSENSSDSLHLSIPTFVKQQQCSAIFIAFLPGRCQRCLQKIWESLKASRYVKKKKILQLKNNNMTAPFHC